MCDGADVRTVAAAAPRPVTGSAVDPVRLEPVDEVVVTTLVDNVFDGLLPGDERVFRPDMAQLRWALAPHFEDGRTLPGLRAEHGFSALVSVRRGSSSTRLLFDTGVSPDGMSSNAAELGIDLTDVQGVVLSHGHFDHVGGLTGLAGRRGVRGLPMTVHPAVWTRRRLAVPAGVPLELPRLSRRALEEDGFEVIERRQLSLLVDGGVLITGEIDRTTEYERGLPPPHQAWDGEDWRHDPLVLDEQALVVHVRDRGLLVLTGCGHAGVVNTVRHAMRLTGVDRVCAVIGGLHLVGPAADTVVSLTVQALAELRPDIVVAGHCSGWRAQQALAAALPGAWIPNSSGSSYVVRAA